MRKSAILFTAAALVMAGSLQAQTVTVAKSGTPTYSTVAAAIAHFATDPDPGTANVIQITDNALYDEIITINVPVTIEGTGASRPVLALQTSSGSDGITISIPTGTTNDVTLRNLILIPSLTTPPADDGINSIGQNLNLTFENLLLSPNNGSNQPLSDGLTEAVLTGATRFGDDGMTVGGTASPAGTGTVATFVNTVVTHVTGDGIVCSGSGLAYNFYEGCVFSYNGRLGIQGNGNFTIDSRGADPNTNPRILIKGNKGFAGLWFAGGGLATRSITGALVLDNTSTGIEFNNYNTAAGELKETIVAGNGGAGIVISAYSPTTGNANPALTLENVTSLANVGEPLIIAAYGGAVANTIQAFPSATVTDSIFGGTGTSPGVTNNNTGTLSLSNSAIILSGTYAVSAATAGTGTVNQTAVINADPAFAGTLDPFNTNYYMPTAAAYDTAGTGSTELIGGAYDLTPVSDWYLY